MKLADLKGQRQVTDDEIKLTDEYKILIREASETVALLTCRMVLRGSFPNIAEASVQIMPQLTVFGAFSRLANNDTQMTWVPSGPGGTNAFVAFITGKSPDFRLTPQTTINCWEAVLLAGILDAQILNPARLKEFYESSPQKFEANLVDTLMQNQVLPYDAGTSSGRPLTGDIVMFDGLSHVAMATGQIIEGPMVDVRTATGSRIISFWPAPFVRNFGPDTRTRIAFTTIEAILAWYDENMPGVPKPRVTFGGPNWRLLGN